MKKITALFIALAFTLLCINVFGQAKTYPFDVKISGKGKNAIIFIPGLGCSGDVWNETRPFFEKNYTCYTFTMAGFAGVPAQDAPSFKIWEDAIVDYITQNKINKPIIIGHSLGGGLALAIAADDPDLPLKIVVVDALPCLAAMQNPAFRSNPNNDCGPIVNYFTSLGDEQFNQTVARTMPQLIDDTVHLKQVIKWSETSDRKTFAMLYCDFSNTDLRDKIANIKCPALILLESSFANLKPAITDEYKNLKTAQLNYADKGKHFIMFDDPTWYNQQLTAFIK